MADGRAWMRPEGIEYFAGDLTEEEKQVALRDRQPPAATLFGTKVARAAWRYKPRLETSSRRNRPKRSIPILSRAAAKRMNATVTEVASSHVAVYAVSPRRGTRRNQGSAAERQLRVPAR